MIKLGYTKAELLAAGLAVQGKNGGIYDKFRNRLMLPVIDVRGDVVAFGSRVLDKSEPKYMNTSETITYSKRRALYAMNLAKSRSAPISSCARATSTSSRFTRPGSTMRWLPWALR